MAEGELKGLAEATRGKHTEHDLIRHNLVVFRGGEGAMQVRAAAEKVAHADVLAGIPVVYSLYVICQASETG